LKLVRDLIVTDNGRPVVKVTAIRPWMSAEEIFGDVRGRLVYHEDPFAPTTDEWPET
jgi:antitoxin (DNA-binding transcriptional repressor) of toxin-antitoxin stability system